MAFPTAAILDNFNRADAQPPSANWSDDPTGGLFAQLQIISNECAPDTGSTIGSGYWNAATFTGDAEVYCTVPVVGGSDFMLLLHLTDIGSAYNGYSLYYTGGTLILSRVDSGAGTSLVAPSQTLSDGDAIGIELVGTTLTVYYKASGGSWTALDTATDGTYTTGYVGLLVGGDTASRIDDFGGGEVSAGSTTLTASLYSDSDTLYTAALTSVYTLTASKLTDGDTTPQAALTSTYTLTAAKLTDGDSLYSAALTSVYTLSANLLSDGDTLPQAALSSTYGLSASLHSDSDSIPQAALTSNYTLTAAHLSDSDTLYTAAFIYTQILTAALYTNDNLLYRAVLTYTSPQTATVVSQTVIEAARTSTFVKDGYEMMIHTRKRTEINSRTEKSITRGRRVE